MSVNPGVDRTRIARDVHDVLGHHLSAIAIQQAVGRRMLDDGDVDGVRRMLDAIEDATIAALAQTRRWIGLPADAPGERLPLLERIDRLAEPARARGIAVSVRQVGDPVALSAVLDEGLERIAQEALTNVMRHASATTTRVVVRFGSRAVQISVVDDGEVGQPNEMGHGLAGMRARAAELGGRLLAGPRTDGGWRVWASVPYAPVP